MQGLAGEHYRPPDARCQPAGERRGEEVNGTAGAFKGRSLPFIVAGVLMDTRRQGRGAYRGQGEAGAGKRP